MAQLTQAFFKKILSIEGGYQNMPDDSGNYACGQLIGTNMGISAGALQTWWGRCPSVYEMKNLTQKEAFGFYSWYFDRFNLYEVQSQQLFELLANNTMGNPTSAAKIEQRVLNTLGYSVSVDGLRGIATIEALNRAWKDDPSALYNGIREEWITYLKAINKPQFLSGWLYRMNHYFPPLGGGNVKMNWGATAAVLLFFFILIKK